MRNSALILLVILIYMAFSAPTADRNARSQIRAKGPERIVGKTRRQAVDPAVLSTSFDLPNFFGTITGVTDSTFSFTMSFDRELPLEVTFYELVVLKLNMDSEGIPRLTKPDPRSWQDFISYTEKPRTEQPYIAARWKRNLFPEQFTVGSEQHEGGFFNGALEPGNFYALFIRGVSRQEFDTVHRVSNYFSSPISPTIPEFFHTSTVSNQQILKLAIGIGIAAMVVAAVFISFACKFWPQRTRAGDKYDLLESGEFSDDYEGPKAADNRQRKWLPKDKKKRRVPRSKAHKARKNRMKAQRAYDACSSDDSIMSSKLVGAPKIRIDTVESIGSPRGKRLSKKSPRKATGRESQGTKKPAEATGTKLKRNMSKTAFQTVGRNESGPVPKLDLSKLPEPSQGANSSDPGRPNRKLRGNMSPISEASTPHSEASTPPATFLKRYEVPDSPNGSLNLDTPKLYKGKDYVGASMTFETQTETTPPVSPKQISPRARKIDPAVNAEKRNLIEQRMEAYRWLIELKQLKKIPVDLEIKQVLEGNVILPADILREKPAFIDLEVLKYTAYDDDA